MVVGVLAGLQFVSFTLCEALSAPTEYEASHVTRFPESANATLGLASAAPTRKTAIRTIIMANLYKTSSPKLVCPVFGLVNESLTMNLAFRADLATYVFA